jgi:hypothetical protein
VEEGLFFPFLLRCSGFFPRHHYNCHNPIFDHFILIIIIILFTEKDKKNDDDDKKIIMIKKQVK